MIEENASYPFPVIGPNRLDYFEPNGYRTSEWHITDGKVKFRHQVRGDNLVSKLLREEKAVFACVLVMRTTMYRRTFTFDGDMAFNEDETSDKGMAIDCEQILELEKGYFFRETPKFLPIVLYSDKKQFKTDTAKSMGLDELWNDKSFTLCRGAIIGRERWYHLFPHPNRLVRFRKNELIPEGSMSVDFCTEESGYILAEVPPNLLKGINEAKGSDRIKHRNSIVTHAISAGLSKIAMLHKESDVDLDSLENIPVVKSMLKHKGVSTWEDEEDFDPVNAACSILPLEITVDAEGQKGEE